MNLTLSGDTFRVVVEGDPAAPVLMLSNSLGTNLHMWDPQMPAFLEHFHVVRYDSRGHGDSVAEAVPYSLAQLGQDALGIMDALGFDKVHWLGLSKGGMVGQWLLTHAPERLDRTILANTAAQMPPPDLWNSRIETVLNKGMAAVTDGVIERWFTAGFRERDPDAVGRIVEMLHTTPAHGYAGCCAAIRDMDQREALRGVRKPVLVIVGREDPATPPEMGALIADAIDGAKLVTLEAAHLSNIEDAESFNQAVIEFLTAPEVAKLPPPRPRKAASRKAPAKKATAKQAPAKQATVKKAAVKKATAKKAPPKKAATKKAVVKNTPPKKAAVKKAAAKKMPVKKSASKKMPTKKATPKKTMAKKTVAKKTVAKKTVAKKTVAKKTVAKKTATKSKAAKTVARRPAGRKFKRK